MEQSLIPMLFAIFAAIGMAIGIISIIKRIPKIWYANILSSMNAFCGMLSIVSSIHYHNLIWAFVFIRLGGVFDLFDGRAARKHGTTKRGDWFDDGADLITFGLATGTMLYEFGGRYAWFYGSAYIVCVAGRLARYTWFDSQRDDLPKKIFNGLPSPAGSDIVTSICLISLDDHILFIAAIFSSLLMISHLWFAHFGRVMSEYVSNSKEKRWSLRVIGAVIAIAALGYLISLRDATLFGWIFLFLIVLYMVVGRITAIRAKKSFQTQVAESV